MVVWGTLYELQSVLRHTHSNSRCDNVQRVLPLLVAQHVREFFFRTVYPIIELSYRNTPLQGLTRGLCGWFGASVFIGGLPLGWNFWEGIFLRGVPLEGGFFLRFPPRSGKSWIWIHFEGFYTCLPAAGEKFCTPDAFYLWKMLFQGRKQSQTSSGIEIWEGIFPGSGSSGGGEFLGGNFLEGGAAGEEFPPQIWKFPPSWGVG